MLQVRAISPRRNAPCELSCHTEKNGMYTCVMCVYVFNSMCVCACIRILWVLKCNTSGRQCVMFDVMLARDKVWIKNDGCGDIAYPKTHMIAHTPTPALNGGLNLKINHIIISRIELLPWCAACAHEKWRHLRDFESCGGPLEQVCTDIRGYVVTACSSMCGFLIGWVFS